PRFYLIRFFLPPPLCLRSFRRCDLLASRIRFTLALALGGISSLPFRIKLCQPLSNGYRGFLTRIGLAYIVRGSARGFPAHEFKTTIGAAERNCERGSNSNPPCGKRAVADTLGLPCTLALRLRFVQQGAQLRHGLRTLRVPDLKAAINCFQKALPKRAVRHARCRPHFLSVDAQRGVLRRRPRSSPVKSSAEGIEVRPRSLHAVLRRVLLVW